jgi:3-deoxy-7-phosphoheptulonate synthase
MIVEMKKKAPQAEIDWVVDKARSLGFEVQLNIGTDKTVVAILGSIDVVIPEIDR